MSGRYKHSWEQLGTASFEFKVMELIRLELELTLTFVNLAHTKYSMGNVVGADVSGNNAAKAYRTALYYFGKLADVSSSERRKLMGLANQAKDAIAKLPKADTKKADTK
jgi:hypothetical protein